MGWCLPVSHTSPEPAGFLSRPVGGRGGTPLVPILLSKLLPMEGLSGHLLCRSPAL